MRLNPQGPLRKGRLPAGAPPAEGVGCTVSVLSPPRTPSWHPRPSLPPQPSLTASKVPFLPGMLAEWPFHEDSSSVFFATEGTAWGYRSLRNLRTMLRSQDPPSSGHASLHSTENREEPFFLLFPIPQERERRDVTAKDARNGERGTRWPATPPHPTFRPSTGPIPKTHSPTANPEDPPVDRESQGHAADRESLCATARREISENCHKPWMPRKLPRAVDSAETTAALDATEPAAGHEATNSGRPD